ncbi:hypothetical protein VspSTUT16_01550 [Vibrio sp. STUT-A16]|nr:hypothetical protein VspSTUT16_01550 [Vibrio sp. STUT-A16]
MVTSLEVISSLTIWKADKTIFKIVCKVLNVYRKINTKKHIQVFLAFCFHFSKNEGKEMSPAKSKCLSLIQIMRDNFGDLIINSKLLRVVWLSD